MSNSIDERQERQAPTSLCHCLIITVTTSYNSSIETSLKVYNKTTTMLNTCQYVNAWNDHTYMS